MAQLVEGLDYIRKGWGSILGPAVSLSLGSLSKTLTCAMLPSPLYVSGGDIIYISMLMTLCHRIVSLVFKNLDVNKNL